MSWSCRRCQRVFLTLPTGEVCPHDGGRLTVITDQSDVDEHTGRICDEKYKIGRVLGSGGMGCVHEAINLRLDQPVAVKFFSPRFVYSTGQDKADAAERFRREATSMAKARHPNVVHVLDFSIESDGTMYIVMERLEGTPLDVLMQSGGLTLGRGLSIMATVLKALEYVHSQGITHRDLKPSNIFAAKIAGRETIKVLDFGIARVSDETTITNGPVGTWRYAAPEQLDGTEVGPNADVYSAGIILAEILLGAPAHRDTLERKAHPKLLPIIERAIEDEPESRFNHVSEMSVALAKVIDELSEEELAQILPTFSTENAEKPKRRSSAPPTPVVKNRAPNVAEREKPDKPDKHDKNAQQAQKKRISPLLIVAIVMVLVIGSIAGVLINTYWPGPGESQVTPNTSETGMTEENQAVAEEQQVKITFVSTPKNASVSRLDGEEEVFLCKTNCIHQLRQNEEPIKVVFRHDGHIETGQTFIPLADQIIEAILPPEAAPDAPEEFIKLPIKGRHKGPVKKASGSGIAQDPTKFGYLSVRAIPQSDVYLDGKRLGKSPIAKRAVTEGRHRLKLVPRTEALGPGVSRPSKTLTVTITAGQTKQIVQYW